MASASKSKRTSKKSRGDKEKKDEWLLPDDMHFSSRQLLRLFLKPKFAVRQVELQSADIDYSYVCVRLRHHGSLVSLLTHKGVGLTLENVNGEIDENFWAQAAADRADFDNGGEDEMGWYLSHCRDLD